MKYMHQMKRGRKSKVKYDSQRITPVNFLPEVNEIVRREAEARGWTLKKLVNTCIMYLHDTGTIPTKPYISKEKRV